MLRHTAKANKTTEERHSGSHATMETTSVAFPIIGNKCDLLGYRGPAISLKYYETTFRRPQPFITLQVPLSQKQVWHCFRSAFVEHFGVPNVVLLTVTTVVHYFH